MRKKLVSCILVVCMLLTMLPTMAWAEEAKVLDIANGSITITADGYTQGTATPTDFIGDYVITQGSADAVAYGVSVTGGEHKITLKDVNMTKAFVVSGTGTSVTMVLDGKNYITTGSSDNTAAVQVTTPASLTIKGSGELYATAGNANCSAIGGGSNNSVKAGTVTIESGKIEATTTANNWVAGLGGGRQTSGTIIINGGDVKSTGLPIGKYTNEVKINGGTVRCPGFVENIVTVTGGNIISSAALPDAIGERKLSKLYVVNANGEAQANVLTDVEVGSKEWSAYTDDNGIINTYLLDEDEVNGKKKLNGGWLVGAECSCAPTAFDWTGTISEEEVYSTEVPIPVEVTVDQCNMPIHKHVITWDIKEGDNARKSDDGKKVVLLPSDNNYYKVTLTATVKDMAGNAIADQPSSAKKEIAVTADKNIKSMDVGKGQITVKPGTGTGKVDYWQGEDVYLDEVDASEKVMIFGTREFSEGHGIYIEKCSPTLVLDDLNLVTNTASKTAPSSILITGTPGGTDTVTLLVKGTNTIDRSKIVTNPYCGIEVKDAKLIIDCFAHHNGDCGDKDCKDKLIINAGDTRGTGIGAAFNGSQACPGYTLDILGGYIDVYARGYGTAIGTGWKNGGVVQENLVTINIQDGYVNATAQDSGVAIGGGRNGTDTNAVVNITGGSVIAEADVVGRNNGSSTIQGKVVDISGETANVTVKGLISMEEITISDGAALNIQQKDNWNEELGGTPGGFANGSIAVEGGSTINGAKLPENSGTANIPGGMLTEIVQNTDGSVTLPAGTAIENEDGSYVVLLENGSVKADGAIDSAAATATIKTPTDKELTVNKNGTVELPAGSVVNGAEIPAAAGTVTMNPDTLDEVKVDAAGNVTLPAGTVIENADGTTTTYPDGASVADDGAVDTEGAKVTENADGSVTITKGDEVTTITPAEGEKVTVNSDGTVTLPKDSPVTITKGEETTTVTPAGGSATVNPDGTVELPAGSTVTTDEGTTTLPAGTGTVTLPTDKLDEVKEDETGAVTLPAGTVIETEEGKTTLPDGGSVNTEGTVATDGTTITEKADGSVTITKDGETTTIAPPAEGGSITVKPDGTVEVPAGSTVKKPDGSSDTLTNGGTVDKDGAVTETPVTPPAGDDEDKPVTPPADDEGDKPTPQPPYIGGYYPSYTPSVTPAAPSVDSSSLNNAALAVGSAIKDGSAEFTPVNGYTKDEVLQLQKDGKLRMGIEKKSGYGSVADKNLAEAAIKSAGGAVSGTSVMYFDITPVLKLDNGTVVAHVTDTEKAITITIELSDELTKAAKDGKDIAVVRVHDGKAEFLSCKLNAAKTKVTFSSADFSTYAVVALNKATSAKTFDAGVAMYVGMAVLAATGSAVVVGKKRK